MNIQNKFEHYFNNELSEPERIFFEKEMSEDPVLKEEYEFYARISRLMRNELHSEVLTAEDDPELSELSSNQRLDIEQDFARFSDPEIREQLKAAKLLEVSAESDEQSFIESVIKAGEKKTEGRYRALWIYTAVAASVAILFLITDMAYNSSKRDSMKISSGVQIFFTHFNPAADREITKYSFSDKRLTLAILDYSRSKQNSSVIFDNELKVSDRDYQLSLMSLGLLSMQRNEFRDAQKCFLKILSLKNPVNYNSARFYLAMSFLAENKIKEASPIFEELNNKGNIYYREAKEILKSISEL
jgi:hypothetical protein